MQEKRNNGHLSTSYTFRCITYFIQWWSKTLRIKRLCILDKDVESFVVLLGKAILEFLPKFLNAKVKTSQASQWQFIFMWGNYKKALTFIYINVIIILS